MRTRPRLLGLWQSLYPGQDIVGCPSVVALTAPSPHTLTTAGAGAGGGAGGGAGAEKGEAVKKLTASFEKFHTGQWLHLDYSPPLPHRMYQSTIYVFPGSSSSSSSSGSSCSGSGSSSSSSSSGKLWPRIGVMTSMAPAAWQNDGQNDGQSDEQSENANSNVVQLTLLAASILGAAGKSPAGVFFGHLQKIGEGYGTKGVKVLKPALRPGRIVMQGSFSV